MGMGMDIDDVERALGANNSAALRTITLQQTRVAMLARRVEHVEWQVVASEGAPFEVLGLRLVPVGRESS